MCDDEYTILPLTITTVEYCDDSCNGRTKIKDNICCCNCFLWPITFILDIFLCPCLYGYYKFQKNKSNDDKIKTEQPS